MGALSGKQLCERLSIDRTQLQTWIGEGLPWTGTKRRKQFDPAAIREWLIDHGKAQTEQAAEQPVARTRDEVATTFGVSLRTVATWIKEGMPGRPGPPGRREGYFPLAEIDAWLEARGSRPIDSIDDTRSASQARLAKARAEMIEMDLAEKRGGLVSADEIARRLVRHIHEARAQLDQLPARIQKLLPEKTPLTQKHRRRIRERIKRTLAEAYRTLELMLRAEGDAETGANSLAGAPGPATPES